MQKSVSAILIAILFLVMTLTISFIWAQEIETIENPSEKNTVSKNMKILTVKNNLQKYGVEVVVSTDQNFDTLLTGHVGKNAEVIQLVETTKPFAFFIKNNSSKDILGVSFRREVTDSEGRTEISPQYLYHGGEFVGVKPHDPWMIGRTSFIENNTIRFFSYFDMVLDPIVKQAYWKIKNPEIKYKDQPIDSQTASFIETLKNRAANNFSNISISVDGIFFDDGTFVGEDKNFFFDYMRGYVQAEKDFLNKVERGKVSGKKNSAILDELLSAPVDNPMFVNGIQPDRLRNAAEAFEFSYKDHLRNKEKDLKFQRSKLPDDLVVKNTDSARITDFVELRKMNNNLPLKKIDAK